MSDQTIEKVVIPEPDHSTQSAWSHCCATKVQHHHQYHKRALPKTSLSRQRLRFDEGYQMKSGKDLFHKPPSIHSNLEESRVSRLSWQLSAFLKFILIEHRQLVSPRPGVVSTSTTTTTGNCFDADNKTCNTYLVVVKVLLHAHQRL